MPALANGWEIAVGGIYAQSESTFTGYLLNGAGTIDLDFERDFRLTENSFLPQFSVGYGFRDRHHVSLSYFRLHREGSQSRVTEAFEFETDEGVYQVQAGGQLTTRLNYDIYRLNYAYDVYQADTLGLSVNGGLHVIPVELAFEGAIAACVNDTCTSNVQRVVSQSITAPLPNAGLHANWVFAPDWALSGGAQFFYLEFEDITGLMTDVSAQVNYTINPHWQVGLGYGLYLVQVEQQLSRRELEVDVRIQGSTLNLQYTF